MSNTNIIVSLDTRRAKKDGSYPLILRLGHNKRTTSIPLGLSVHEKDWDEKNRIVKKSYAGTASVTRLNNLLQKRKSEAMDIIVKLEEAGQLSTLSVTDIRDRIVKTNNHASFFYYANTQIAELVKAGRIGTARSYKGVVSVLKRFRKDKDLPFHEINYSFLSKFENYHKSNGNGVNGLSVYLRGMRAIFNKAVKEGLVEKELYPFEDYKIKSEPTEKRALDWELLEKIIALRLEPGHVCFDTRNYFVASYMMYGMNFADIAFLLKTDIVDGRIKYRRRKTGKLYDIKITGSLQAILDHYMQQKLSSKYIFPVINRENPILRERDIQWARKRYNKKLKELAKLCGIGTNLTSYVSRHSFATQAMMQNVPLTVISAMMGHSSVKTTEIYLKGLPSNVLDQYNAMIVEK